MISKTYKADQLVGRKVRRDIFYGGACYDWR